MKKLLQRQSSCRFTRWAAICAAGIMLMMCGITGRAAQTATANTDNVNVRTQASAESERVCKVLKSTELTVVDQTTGSDGNVWYSVTFTHEGTEKSGWIRSDMVTVTETEDPAEEGEGEGSTVSAGSYSIQEPIETYPASDVLSQTGIQVGEESFTAWVVDAGVTGADNFRRSVTQGVLTSGIVRILLFLAVLGTCGLAAGNAAQIIDASNPAAEAFKLAAGDLGYRLFGLCLFSAGVSSVVGAAFTSVSFLKTLHPVIMKYEKWFVVGFIAFSTLMMVIVGNAAQLLIIAGAVNGLILPISLTCMLAASFSKKIVGDYKHPMWLTILGLIVIVISAIVGIQAVPGIMKLFG